MNFRDPNQKSFFVNPNFPSMPMSVSVHMCVCIYNTKCPTRFFSSSSFSFLFSLFFHFQPSKNDESGGSMRSEKVFFIADKN